MICITLDGEAAREAIEGAEMSRNRLRRAPESHPERFFASSKTAFNYAPKSTFHYDYAQFVDTRAIPKFCLASFPVVCVSYLDNRKTFSF
jgi:hypothetical protein